MFRKVTYALWVLLNLYLIFDWSRQCYQYYVNGNTTGAIIRLVLIIGFVLLTALIIYRDIKDYLNRKNHIPTYPNYCGQCVYQNECPNKPAKLKLFCGVKECKYWKEDKET